MADGHLTSAPNPATQYALTLAAMLDDSTITTVCKVIGGLSTDELLTDFAVNFNGSSSINFLQVDSPSLTFIEKLSRTDNHLTQLTTIQNINFIFGQLFTKSKSK